jgi:hypothetical protein
MNQRYSVVCILGLACALSATATAGPWIDMGLKDEIAFDQPAVAFELRTAGGTSLGPTGGDEFFGVTNRFILDTGATSIIAMNDAADELDDNGYVVENTVLEQGVAGFSELDVSAEYTVRIADSDGATLDLTNHRIMSGQFEDLFGVNGIVGMPGMVGRVVTLDTSVWAEIEDIFDLVPMDVRIANSLPAGNGHRYSVPIRAQAFDVVGDAPLPSAAPIPFVEMSVGFEDANATGSFILDTGAAISFISTDMAIAIGLDSNNDGVLDTSDEQSDGALPIGGIGGTIEAPLFYIDRFSVATEQGVDLVWSLEGSLSVVVIDIHPDIDGVLGSDLLTSGWFSGLFDEEQEELIGPLQQVHFDFRQFFETDDTGKIYFDLTPSYDVVQSGNLAGDYNGDGAVDARDYTIWRDSLGAIGANLPADGNNNGSIDPGDYTVWKNNFGQGAGSGAASSSAVPEPATFMMLALATAVAALLRQRQPLAIGDLDQITRFTAPARSAASTWREWTFFP